MNPAQKGRLCRKMDPGKSGSHCSHASCQIDLSLRMTVLHVNPNIFSMHTWQEYTLTVWNDWTEHSAALASDEEGTARSTPC